MGGGCTCTFTSCTYNTPLLRLESSQAQPSQRSTEMSLKVYFPGKYIHRCGVLGDLLMVYLTITSPAVVRVISSCACVHACARVRLCVTRCYPVLLYLLWLSPFFLFGSIKPKRFGADTDRPKFYSSEGAPHR